MELLVIGIDAVTPKLLFDEISNYPNLEKLYSNGIAGDYDGYVYGYGSPDNWITMYTGISPKQHGTIKGRYSDENLYPQPIHYQHLQPLWEVLNENGYTTAFWKALATSPPVSVDGFMVSGEANFEYDKVEEKFRTFLPLVCEKDKNIICDYSIGDIDKPPYPERPEHYNYTWEYLQDNPNLIDEILNDDYFQSGLTYYKNVLELSYENIEKAYLKQPTDLFWFYDATFDYLQHFQMHDENQVAMKKALHYVDDFVGKIIKLMKPKNILFISDHGQRAIIDFFPNCSTEIRKEAFGLSSQSIISDENIVLKGRTPGFFTGIHDLKATMIWSGEKINSSGDVSKGQTLDIYPTILELFNIIIPNNKEGYILPVLNKDILNKQYIKHLERTRDVLFIQNCSVSEFNGVINEYYYENRDARITVAIDMKFEEVFKANYQVCNIIDKQNKKFQLEFIEIYEV